MHADYDLVETFNMEVAAGRSFSREFGSDEMHYLINEKMQQAMGGGDVIGKQISFWGASGQVVGVVKDFNMNSLYAPIEPTIIRLDPTNTELVFVRTMPGQAAAALTSLETVYGEFNPDYPLDYRFLDQVYEQTYRSEAILGRLANLFALVALLISCLGLFGLTAFTVEQRTKEIGVRKILGASAPRLMVMLTATYTRLVVIGIGLALAPAYLLLHRWLDHFVDPIPLKPWVFLVAGAFALLIAWMTVSALTASAALANPVKSLRYE
jgi:ABC-type antimicrobial peptide transport system permease subunit